MPLSGTRLKGNEKSGILSQLQILFPVNVALLPAEQVLLNAAQDKTAEAFAFGGAPATVAEITGNALVNTTGPDPQGGSVVSIGTVL